MERVRKTPLKWVKLGHSTLRLDDLVNGGTENSWFRYGSNMMKKLILLLPILTIGLGFSTNTSSNEICFSKSAHDYLLGKWSLRASTWNFKRDGDTISWTWERGEGQNTKQWGIKKTAKGEGKVSNIQGCSFLMEGEYTSFNGSDSGFGVGHSITYKLKAANENMMTGTGLGLGEREYRLKMMR